MASVGRYSKSSPLEAEALKRLPALVRRWLPNGELRGRYWVAGCPNQSTAESRLMKVDLRTGAWRDWTVGKKGYGAISLAAYLADLSHKKAEAELGRMLGISDE